MFCQEEHREVTTVSEVVGATHLNDFTSLSGQNLDLLNKASPTVRQETAGGHQAHVNYLWDSCLPLERTGVGS